MRHKTDKVNIKTRFNSRQLAQALLYLNSNDFEIVSCAQLMRMVLRKFSHHLIDIGYPLPKIEDSEKILSDITTEYMWLSDKKSGDITKKELENVIDSFYKQ